MKCHHRTKAGSPASPGVTDLDRSFTDRSTAEEITLHREIAGTGSTPGAFYNGMRLMAIDGFVVDLADTPKNERAFWTPRKWTGCRGLSPGQGALTL